MPDAQLPDDPETAKPHDWYSEAAKNVLRLSSKSHWDVVIEMPQSLIHFLVSHPTPPVFDGPEDRNGRRNHDEIRFWVDYVTPGKGDYIRDDRGGRGGLRSGESFVIAGDLNADPFDGDDQGRSIQQLLTSKRVLTIPVPESLGAAEQARLQAAANERHRGRPEHDTGDFQDDPGPGNLRLDYVLPSSDLRVADCGVFWPTIDNLYFPLVGTFPNASSDHHLVWVDLEVAK
jgi:3-phytase